MQTSPSQERDADLHDVIIIGAGPCGLGVAARLHEETPSAMFTDEEHQRYHWIKKHAGRMKLIQARGSKMNGAPAEKWNFGQQKNCSCFREENAAYKERRRSIDSTSSEPSLSSLLSTSSAASYSTLVLDGSDDKWMKRWNDAFRALEIKQLRSPMFFHVDPGDRDGLLGYTQEMGREDELWEIPGAIGVEIDERDRKDYFSPSPDLFKDYCSSIVERYGLNQPGQILRQEVTNIEYDFLSDSLDSKIFTVTTSTGQKFYSRAVVLAIGVGGTDIKKVFPWRPLSKEEGSEACCHSMDIKLFPFPGSNLRRKIQYREQTNVVVVGGGLSSAQIVDMVVRKGVTRVWLLMRSDLKVKHFDISLPWMGKYKNWEKAAFWSADTDQERLGMIKAARNGGSITPRYVRILKSHAANHRASIHPRTVIESHAYNPETHTWTLTTDPPIPDLPPIDYIYFATGARADVREMPLLSQITEKYPIEVQEGLPCLTDDLMWREDVPLYMTGRMAALRLGPGAPNLEGARLGAERIVWSLEEILEKDRGIGKQCEWFCGLGNRNLPTTMKEPQPPPPDILDAPVHHPTEKPLRFLVIGAGSRGNAYARAVTTTTKGSIHAVAEPHPFKRREFGQNYIWGSKGSPFEGQEFSDWREWVQWEKRRRENASLKGKDEGPVGVDGVFVCTLDETHIEVLKAISPLKLHVLCEKPLALSLEDCLTVYRTLQPPEGDAQRPRAPTNIFSIGHVLRYSPHNMLLRKLLLTDRVIGDIVSLEHCEPVGWWHFSHSYVRGNWRRATPTGDGSLLTKSCHDIDFILWLLCSPPSLETARESGHKPHFPRSISSTGSLTQFRRARKPAAAKDATNCLSCPAERDCSYSALRIYKDRHFAKGHLKWPVDIVCPDIEDVYTTEGEAAAESYLLSRLSEDYNQDTDPDVDIAARPWYGRCVYEADNNVCDDQVVTFAWDDENEPPNRLAKTASFHMIAPTEKQCERRGRVYGTTGEIEYDSQTISIYDFASAKTSVIDVPRPPPERAESHGGGDYGLAGQYVRAVDAVVNGGLDVETAQARFVGCTLEEAVRSHAIVFATEEARREEKVVKWGTWWDEKLRASIS
ncbi:hypothetical protein N7495_008031 [Penicillium taxi]|uniref:uncharacterized protein n=1 Tax=Penicillium taxi TaxID=168475 RepID=UPI0025450AB3|nr:uncharacterized protein N7495_008031 [Penicillium taxi]KAJ5887990.1 hypothetical protein N7495_008031 [Penicillium taxi]